MTRRNGSESPSGGVNPGRYGSGWGRPGTEGESCLYVPRHLDKQWLSAIRTIIGEFMYVHSYSVEGQSLVSLVVFVQSKSGCK
jgi:hypothetical protein